MLVAAVGYFLAVPWGRFITMMRLLFIYSSNGHVRAKKKPSGLLSLAKGGRMRVKGHSYFENVDFHVIWYKMFLKVKATFFLLNKKWMRPALDVQRSLGLFKHSSTCSELWRSLSEGEGHCTPLGSGHVDRELPPLVPLIPDLKADQPKEQFVNPYVYKIPSMSAIDEAMLSLARVFLPYSTIHTTFM